MASTSSSANGASLKKTESYSASKSAMAAIFGPDHKYNKGGSGNDDVASGSGTSREEPPSGIKGKGTAEEPYDQGNAPEQIPSKSTTTSGQINGTSSAGQEPLSGAKGKGTADEPYDQGNAGGASAGQEPLSGAKGKGTADEPYDQGNAGESTAGSQPINATRTTAATTTNGTASTSTPPTTSTPAVTEPKSAAATAEPAKKESQDTSSRGRTLAPPTNDSRFERSVSPGTLDDGTHETCSGERGGGYTPSSGLGRLANKLKGR